ncbi:hypothetical protein DPMN_074865 [Dreissena polymorpha]|uniref:CCHC-type domain-containing protein n=1 Tax=Dreissena polymorpha TaxID=45954 RepID=A0A9D4BLY9_DREPO|nr:hypothetical protein DPMN_074865 [Dreissena polymorpha]
MTSRSHEEEDSDKSGLASGGCEQERTLTTKEQKLLDALRELNMDPQTESGEDIGLFVRRLTKKTDEERKPRVSPFEYSMPRFSSYPETGTYHFPKLSAFSGEDNKGEATWDAFRYEIHALLTEGTFTEKQIMLGLRRSMKGTAGDILRRLGPGASLHEVLKKLESTYGNIESQESVMRKFYSCTQGAEEVTAYASRLEDLFARAIELKAIKRGNDEILKQVLFQGLKLDLKHIAQYKYDTIDDYDRFKIELRRLEKDLQMTDKKRTCNVAQKPEKEEKSEINELKAMVHELNRKIEDLQKGNNNPNYYVGRGIRRGRFQQPPLQRGGRGMYRPSRPLGSNNFRGPCYACGDRGHFARDCPNDMQKGKYGNRNLKE